MSNPDPSKVIFSSRYKYFLNHAKAEGSVSIPAASIPAFESRSYSVSIPITNAGNYSQIKINFSHIPNSWYVFPPNDIPLDANFNIKVIGSYDASSLTLTFYVVNVSGSSNTNTATNVTVRAYLFETP